jgi:hypothetical protein
MVAEDPGREFEELWQGTQERLRERLEWMDLDMEAQKIRSSRYRRDMDRYGTAESVMPEFGWRPSSN